jgi:hypothetical protein
MTMATAKKITPVAVNQPAAPATLPKAPVAPTTPPKASVAPTAPPKAPAAKKLSPAKKAPRKPAAAPLLEKIAKLKKPKLVRDSFTIPKVEYVVLEALKQRAAKHIRAVKKSELLRAGIKALAAMPDAAFLAALASVPAIKTGRPAA